MEKAIHFDTKRYFTCTCISIIILSLIIILLDSHFVHAKTIKATLLWVTEHQISGHVQDEEGSPLVGVSIRVKGTTQGTTTNANGDYVLNVDTGSETIVFSFIGYTSQEVAVNGRTVVNLTLKASASLLDNVVVTALGINRSERSLGYSVTELKMDSLTYGNETNFINMLSGKVPGMVVTQSAGGPYGSSRIVIRGNKSLTGDNQPLYVIDGVPIQNQSEGNPGSGKYAGSVSSSGSSYYDMGDIMSSLDPNNIESISILKGASAAALYGSIASNGVIMITTKTGANKSKINVEYNTSFTIETQATKFNDRQTTYGQGLNGNIPHTAFDAQQSVFSGWGPRLNSDSTFTAFNEKEYPYVLATGALKSFFQTGKTWSNSVSFSQNVDKSSFRFAYSNITNTDIVPHTGMTRNNFNLRSTTSLAKNLRVSTNVSYMHEKVKNRPGLGDAYNNIAKSFFGLANNIDPKIFSEGYKTPEGYYIEWGGGRYNYNPYWVINDMENESKKDRLFGALTVDYNFLNDFSIQIRGSRNENKFDFMEFSPFSTPNAEEGQLIQRNNKYTTTQANFMVSYDKDLSKSFHLTARAGMDYYNWERKSQLGTYKTIQIEDIISPNAFKDKAVTDNYSRKVKNSIFGLATLSYKDLLYLDATVRRDASSTLPKDNNTYAYPSLSMSFIFTDAFRNSLPSFLSYGKLRASAAEVGEDTNPYALDLTYETEIFPFNGESAGKITGNRIPNKALKPTRTRSFEAGLDLEFFDGRLNFGGTVYTSNSRDQISTVSAPYSSGFTSQILNVGTIRNSGVELSLEGKLIANDKVNWSVSVNMAQNTNKVLSLAEGVPFLVLAQARWLGVQIVAMPGQPYGTILGHDILRDPNGNPILDPTSRRLQQTEGVVPLGNGTFKWTGGLMNRFRYKNIGLTFSLDIKQGADLFSMTNMYNLSRGFSKSSLEGRDEWIQSEKDREAAGMTPEEWLASGKQKGYVPQGVIEVEDANGKVSYVPNEQAISPTSYYSGYVIDGQGVASPFIYDASYVKVRDISVSYRFNSGLVQKLRLSNLSIALVARNPFIISKHVPNIDPDSNTYPGNGQGLEYGSLPQRRSFGVSLNVNF